MMMYIIGIGALVIFWLVAFDRPVLNIKFQQGRLSKIKGHLPPSFQHNLKEIGEHSPFDGRLKVYRTSNGMRLVFSKEIPKKIQQRISNVFPHQGFKSNHIKKKA